MKFEVPVIDNNGSKVFLSKKHQIFFGKVSGISLEITTYSGRSDGPDVTFFTHTICHV